MAIEIFHCICVELKIAFFRVIRMISIYPETATKAMIHRKGVPQK